MRRISLFQTLAFTMSTLVAVICIVVSSLFSVTYYFFADQELKTALQDTSSILTKDYLLVADGTIKYAEQPTQVSITELLRSRDISLVVFDQNLQRVGTFGIYRFVFEKENSHELEEEAKSIQNVRNSSKPAYTHITINEATYEAYTVPLKNGDTLVGYIQLAKSSSFISKLNKLNIILLLISIPPMVVIAWILVYWLLKIFLRPLRTLVGVFATVSTERLPHQLTTESRFIELHQLVESCNTMINRLKTGIENQKYFSAFASHELRTPLTRAITDLEIISRNSTTTDGVSHLEKVITHIEDTNEILDSLLLLLQPLKIDSNVSASLQKSFEKFKDNFAHLSAEKNIQIVIEGNIHQQLHIQQNHLDMILGNLLSNALKYSPAGSIIRLIITNTDDTVSFSVSDTEPGISEDEQQSIFQPFFRTSSQTAVQGIGIGLAVVKRLCQVYHLHIALVSKVGVGSTFTISGFK